MAAPPAALPPPAEARRVDRRMRIRISFSSMDPDNHDMEADLEFRVHSLNLGEILANAFTGIIRNEVREQEPRGQRVAPTGMPVPPPPPRNEEIRFEHVREGRVRCSRCHVELPVADVGTHVQTHVPPPHLAEAADPNPGPIIDTLLRTAPQLINMRQVQEDPPPAEPTTSVLGTVENAEEGIVRLDGAILFDDLPEDPRRVHCRLCDRLVWREDLAQHTTVHRQVAPPAA